MKPYYEDEWATLYHGDCCDVLPSIPNDSVHMLLTDPPYGIRFQSNHRQQQFSLIANDDESLDLNAILALILPKIKRSRHLYVFGPCDFGDLPVCARTELIWDKGIAGMGDLSIPWGQAHERIAFGAYQISKANRESGDGNLSARLRRGSILKADRINAAAVTKHPTEKPVVILRQMIESSTVMGETVLDPFAGSGSTLVAASLEGRKSIGIELDERYCEVAAKRLSQQTMFREEAV